MNNRKQKYTSAKTSINTLPSVFKKVKFIKGASVLDYGGGKYDKVKKFLRKKGLNCNIYDPYNRPKKENFQALNYGIHNGYDYVVSANLLNVIYEDEVILNILNNMKAQAKGCGEIYVQVYVGSRNGIGKKTTKGYQRNQKPPFYRPYIERIFPQEEGYEITRKSNIYKIINVFS
jgi:hypothetical protein